MDRFSYLHAADPALVEEQYKKFLEDTESVDSGWRQFFDGFEFARKYYPAGKKSEETVYPSEFKVINLINGYRQRGHLFTKTNPVRTRRKYTPTLDRVQEKSHITQNHHRIFLSKQKNRSYNLSIHQERR